MGSGRWNEGVAARGPTRKGSEVEAHRELTPLHCWIGLKLISDLLYGSFSSSPSLSSEARRQICAARCLKSL